ncbi:4-(cytidine 5'-diphospho)-2-C-methyl-D-erythritol kinase [Bosea sp. (in: a-proteobacteria)]|uniref:4-(cytidine 5'-diphospho)-2-C-methyl-D-erythritol kinase n=1 Tax=Bosea sp. (in: a-proteobacteria) TaxID=1871050 RepID=UPI0011F8C313|nr:4-(cytidine 5'-diphospho)-2-C-methyl-D-erythritol kinase [Bosea sp. (in: a-proteobacteria)]TAJ29853.1 MAG: 4-(cytidine 5'-diphospho)-2-C-methyl-D-erythritol kinase [Bosea sp. (in: a-proteobacteria)]
MGRSAAGSAAGKPADLTTRARAKVNLDLRVLGRRADGYHELDSLVAFAGIGDELSLDPSGPLGLTISGPRSAGLEAGPGNLVLRAAGAFLTAYPDSRSGAFHLVKRLPVASGIGGGSADAAAALRLLARLNGLPPATPRLLEIAAAIGADVPVCLESRARLMGGIGGRLGPSLRLPQLPALLVNPGVPVETVTVFKALGLAASGERAQPRPAAEAVPATVPGLHAGLAASRNDLEPPAMQVAPVVAEVLERLRALPGCRLARMSGSGATCYALFEDKAASLAAGRDLRRESRGWWIAPTVLR